VKTFFIILLIFGGGFFYYQSHPTFNHPVHWVAAYVQQPQWIPPLFHQRSLQQRGKDKGTALHYATKYNPQASMIKWLLQQGADADILDQYGYPPVYYALQNKKKLDAFI